ncbi:hypothetical protein GDO86_012321 [Hymenochirus boettgeri]|uniref:Uncharacterized protein n=1 Tax=Hymenochirus boettgeri TaxID=247094 RepID=A0A8T2IM20_9PIPI|nr:hypothetical protein GDO86_012321 [Hymenochirus boettgeri]
MDKTIGRKWHCLGVLHFRARFLTFLPLQNPTNYCGSFNIGLCHYFIKMNNLHTCNHGPFQCYKQVFLVPPPPTTLVLKDTKY